MGLMDLAVILYLGEVSGVSGSGRNIVLGGGL